MLLFLCVFGAMQHLMASEWPCSLQIPVCLEIKQGEGILGPWEPNDYSVLSKHKPKPGYRFKCSKGTHYHRTKWLLNHQSIKETLEYLREEQKKYIAQQNALQASSSSSSSCQKNYCELSPQEQSSASYLNSTSSYNIFRHSNPHHCDTCQLGLYTAVINPKNRPYNYSIGLNLNSAVRCYEQAKNVRQNPWVRHPNVLIAINAQIKYEKENDLQSLNQDIELLQQKLAEQKSFNSNTYAKKAQKRDAEYSRKVTNVLEHVISELAKVKTQRLHDATSTDAVRFHGEDGKIEKISLLNK